jgi:glyoxylase-like metal-dependent hydrolase (beta-lactamase superfamily II)
MAAVIKGVELLETYANTYVLTEQRLILVDTGSEPNAAKLLDGMKRRNLNPADLTSIFVTHVHGDHASGLAALKAKAPGAHVIAHDVEAPFISQAQQYPGPPRPAQHQGAPVDVRLKEGQSHDGLMAISTPGHTRGSMSLLDPARRLLIAGDALRTEGGLAPMEDQYNADPVQHRASIKKLVHYDFDVLVCGHGPPIVAGAHAQVKALAARL